MSDLFDRRVRFTELLPRLILAAGQLGYRCTANEVLRSPIAAAWNAQHGLGTSNSLHLCGLAIDLNLFRTDGSYITDGTGHTELGAYWKTLDPLARWGGDFTKKDFNHYSLTYQGRS